MNDLEGDFNFSDLDGAFNMNNPERSDNAHYLEATYPHHSGVAPMIGNNEGGERPSAWTGLNHEQCCSDLDEAIEMVTDMLNKVKMTRKLMREQDDTETDLQAMEEMKWGIQNLHRPPQEGRGRQELPRALNRMSSRPGQVAHDIIHPFRVVAMAWQPLRSSMTEQNCTSDFSDLSDLLVDDDPKLCPGPVNAPTARHNMHAPKARFDSPPTNTHSKCKTHDIPLLGPARFKHVSRWLFSHV
ncbi:hypothetical protein B0J13DRAFT_534568 [Dactylonectria estremocensis]|nr:hypothetical protein B0J13DRAFT_534568 [Dactylonectria estremocensis]